MVDAQGRQVVSDFRTKWSHIGENSGHILLGSFPSGKRRRHHDAARVTDFPAAATAAPYRGAGGAAAAVQPYQVRSST